MGRRCDTHKAGTNDPHSNHSHGTKTMRCNSTCTERNNVQRANSREPLFCTQCVVATPSSSTTPFQNMYTEQNKSKHHTIPCLALHCIALHCIRLTTRKQNHSSSLPLITFFVSSLSPCPRHDWFSHAMQVSDLHSQIKMLKGARA